MALVLTKKEYIGLTNPGAEADAYAPIGWSTYERGTLRVYWNDSEDGYHYSGVRSFYYNSSSWYKQYQRVDLLAWAFTADEIARGTLRIIVRGKAFNYNLESAALIGVRTVDAAEAPQDAYDSEYVDGVASGKMVWFTVEQACTGRADTRYVDVIVGSLYYAYLDDIELEVQLWEEESEAATWPVFTTAVSASTPSRGNILADWVLWDAELAASGGGGTAGGVTGQLLIDWPLWEAAITGQVGNLAALTATWPLMGASFARASQLSVEWPLWAFTGNMKVGRVGTLQATWPVWSASLTRGGQLALGWPSWSAELRCTPPTIGRLTATWPQWSMAIHADVPLVLALGATWPSWSASLRGTQPTSGALTLTWPLFNSVLHGVPASGASLSVAWPVFSAALTQHVLPIGDLDLLWPVWEAALTGKVPISADFAATWPVLAMGGYYPGMSAATDSLASYILRYTPRN